MKKFSFSFLFLFCFFMMIPASYAAIKRCEVKGLRIWPSPENTRLVFDLSGPVDYRELKKDAQEKSEVVLELKHASINTDFSKLKLLQTRIKNIKSILQKENNLKVVIELEKPLKTTCFTLTPNQQYGHRLVIDLEESEEKVEIEQVNKDPLSQKDTLQKADVSQNENVSQKEKEDIIAMFIQDSNSAPTPTAKTTATLTPIPAKKRLFVIAIDPGHGGDDPGAIGPRGTREKDVVLAISRYLKTMIDKEPGMHAVLIRSGDYYVALQDRVLRARKRKADLFISIHADAFKDKRASGASVFTLSERGASSTAARWLADHENRSDLIGGVPFNSKNKVLASVLLDLSQSASKEEGLKAAGHILKSIGGMASLHSGHVEQAGFAVLKAPEIPSMLVETGFISHPPTERKLRTPEYQRKIASAILQGIRHYVKRKG